MSKCIQKRKTWQDQSPVSCLYWEHNKTIYKCNNWAILISEIICLHYWPSLDNNKIIHVYPFCVASWICIKKMYAIYRQQTYLHVAKPLLALFQTSFWDGVMHLLCSHLFFFLAGLILARTGALTSRAQRMWKLTMLQLMFFIEWLISHFIAC